jgi:hypothetical protein
LIPNDLSLSASRWAFCSASCFAKRPLWAIASASIALSSTPVSMGEPLRGLRTVRAIFFGIREKEVWLISHCLPKCSPGVFLTCFFSLKSSKKGKKIKNPIDIDLYNWMNEESRQGKPLKIRQMKGASKTARILFNELVKEFR